MDYATYLLRSTIAFSLLFIPYQLWFRRQTFFRLCRIYLLATGFISLVVPFLPALQTARTLHPPALPVVVAHAWSNATTPVSNAGWSVAGIIYLAGFGFFLALLLYRLLRVFRLIRPARKTEAGTWLLDPQSRSGAFSFFNRIFLPANVDAETRALMLRHERVHARELHSIDNLFYELLMLFFWFNPLYRLAAKQLSATHEFIADEQACGDDVVLYKQVLVGHALGLPRQVLVHPFSTPGNLKQRLLMLNKNRTSPRARWAYAVALPLLLFTVAINSFNCTRETPAQQAAKMPEYKGGTSAMMKYLGENTVYPEDAKTAKVEGTVYVGFTVSEEGKVTGAKVLKPVSPSLDAEALRVVSSMPDWTPGEKDGAKTATEMTLPIRFALN